MKIHRFLYPHPLHKGECSLTDPALVHQIRTVLRLRVGSSLVLVHTDLHQLYYGQITAVFSDRITIYVNRVVDAIDQSRRSVHLFLSILKKENFEIAVQKGTEIGMRSCTALLCEYTVKTGLSVSRLEKIIAEAVEQSHQTFLPTYLGIAPLSQALHSALGEHQQIVVCDTSTEYLLTNITSSFGESVACFIGPEGGWSQSERDVFTQYAHQYPDRFFIVGLGPSVLRAETAAIVCVYTLLNL
jgi:16S rRNA (uracil1498-N3)-methyltransferase